MSAIRPTPSGIYQPVPKFNPNGRSYGINQRIKALLQEGFSIYRIDAPLLANLEPDLIITQDHCKVCAASVEIISVSPTNLHEVYASIIKISKALNKQTGGEKLCQSMWGNFNRTRAITQKFVRKTLLCIEWLESLMTAGNRVPELAQIAGDTTLAATSGEHSTWIDWKKIAHLNPDVLCIMAIALNKHGQRYPH